MNSIFIQCGFENCSSFNGQGGSIYLIGTGPILKSCCFLNCKALQFNSIRIITVNGKLFSINMTNEYNPYQFSKGPGWANSQIPFLYFFNNISSNYIISNDYSSGLKIQIMIKIN